MAADCVAPDGKRADWVCLADVWEDCDKRMRGRRVLVVDLQPDGRAVVADTVGKRTRLSPRRMYRHSTGFVLVSKACPEHSQVQS